MWVASEQGLLPGRLAPDDVYELRERDQPGVSVVFDGEEPGGGERLAGDSAVAAEGPPAGEDVPDGVDGLIAVGRFIAFAAVRGEPVHETALLIIDHQLQLDP